MKNIFAALAFIVVLLNIAESSQAQWSFVGGLRLNDVESKEDTLNPEQQLSGQVGILYAMDFSGRIKFRTGLLYTQRKFKLENTGVGTFNLDFAYLDFPGTFYWLATDSLRFFGGALLGLNIADDCKFNSASCTPDDTEGLIFQPLLGFEYLLSSSFGIQAYYELGISDIYEQAENLTAIGVNLIYHFDF